MAREVAVYERRVAELDAGPLDHQGEPPPLDALVHFIDVMTWNLPIDAEIRASAAEVDAIVSGSRLLARLESVAPEIVTGPLRRDAQYWMSFDSSDQYRPLDPAYFIGALDAPAIGLSTKPFYVGLFTCTGVLGTCGMWRLYLDRQREINEINAPFWHTWDVAPEPDARVVEIASAADWVDLVLAHPRPHDAMLYPDWRAVAQHFDGVHMTLRGIAATQGLLFPTDQGLIAPTFWDVESTFWLRWCFRSVRLVAARTKIAQTHPPSEDT